MLAHVGGHDKGALAAFDAKTGDLKWSAGDDGPAYALPVATLAGKNRSSLRLKLISFR